ncbi:MAG: hypothetical protein ACLP7P_05505 [Rhodomicrobium sp.]
MQNTKIALLRDAIENTKQVKATVRNLVRIFCPHILGQRKGHWCVVAWQFEGYSNRGDLPNWRCFEVNEMEEIKTFDGPWYRGSLRSKRHKIFPMERVDTLADSAHIGHVRAQERGFSLFRMFLARF